MCIHCGACAALPSVVTPVVSVLEIVVLLIPVVIDRCTGTVIPVSVMVLLSIRSAVVVYASVRFYRSACSSSEAVSMEIVTQTSVRSSRIAEGMDVVNIPRCSAVASPTVCAAVGNITRRTAEIKEIAVRIVGVNGEMPVAGVP